MEGYSALTRSVIVQFYRPQPYASLAKRNGNGLLIHVRGVRLPDDAPDMICRSRIVTKIFKLLIFLRVRN